MTDLTVARALFVEHHLPFPEVDDSLAPLFVRRGEWMFSTRASGPPPYALSAHVEQYMEDPAPGPSIVLAHDGRGSHSWAIHWYVTMPGAAVFVQSPWGAVDTSPEDEAVQLEEMAERFRLAARVLSLVDAQQAGSGRRLVVVESGFGDSRWAWGAGEPEWHSSPTSLADALDALSS